MLEATAQSGLETASLRGNDGPERRLAGRLTLCLTVQCVKQIDNSPMGDFPCDSLCPLW